MIILDHKLLIAEDKSDFNRVIEELHNLLNQSNTFYEKTKISENIVTNANHLKESNPNVYDLAVAKAEREFNIAKGEFLGAFN